MPGRTTSGNLVSGQDALHRVPVHIGKPALDTIMVEGQAFVIHPKEMKARVVQVVPVEAKVVAAKKILVKVKAV